MATSDDACSIEGKAGHCTCDNASGNEDFCSGKTLLNAVGSLDFDNACLGNARISLDVIDLVFLKEKLNSTSEFVGYLSGAPYYLIPVIFEPGDLKTEISSMMSYE